ncbi:hypothetical protein CDD82_911 [Ophiocordyceps australis]|uniref:DUF8035 domain-containing protein n=1 Tax=Ophiocordyceps australis TaxID=1399860 RepID=A0A2C5ZPN5_9HYPO|nr:hypothetical protein CDD82_911 [Ophiocordyceps australis]
MAAERWDRDRFMYERDRLEDDRYYMRGGRSRDHSDERFDRRRPHYEDDMVRDRERRYHDDDFRHEGRRQRPGDYDRRVFIEQERDREYVRDASPRRPTTLRRQSSLDTFDRRHVRNLFDRPEYPPPARREDIHRDDYRVPPYMPIPLPKTRALPPPRRYPDRGFYNDPADYDPYGDDDIGPIPERLRERELIRSRERRDRSRESRVTRSHTHRSSSCSSTVTSRSSSSAGGTAIGDEYPKKGKTRIPARLVSKQAIIDLNYPYIIEGGTIIVQKALSERNIDELLNLSSEYMRAEAQMLPPRSSAGNVVEDRHEDMYQPPLPPTQPAPNMPAPNMPPPPPPQQPMQMSPPPVASYGPALGPPMPPPPPDMETVEKTKVVTRELSPSRTSTSASSWDTHNRLHGRHHDELVVGPLVERSRSRSRSGREIRAEIRALERQLAHRPRSGELGEREIVRTERLPDGELVVYQEKVERQVAGPKPPRIEKDKKGRLSISVPKYR